MKISTKGRYALRLLLDIAQNQQDGFVSLKEIAERQEVSKKYLEQIIPLLSRAELLQTSRGYQGGYRLCRAPEDYTVYEILSVAEGGLAPVACLDQPENTCPRAPDCLTLPVWEGLEKTIRDYLRSITLQSMRLPNSAWSFTVQTSPNRNRPRPGLCSSAGRMPLSPAQPKMSASASS